MAVAVVVVAGNPRSKKPNPSCSCQAVQRSCLVDNERRLASVVGSNHSLAASCKRYNCFRIRCDLRNTSRNLALRQRGA